MTGGRREEGEGETQQSIVCWGREEGVDNPQATSSLMTKVWVKGGREGVDARAAVVMAWLSLALEGMEIGIGGGGD